uniref:Uncharacterized protein n=2 Tax=Clastoptera arizonana TaxID=38151 RepID=A0A1B6DK72_9HEMI
MNRVSQSRINEIGPDRACAEWLMRNGALIRWKGDTNFLTSYDNLPKDDEATGKKFHLQEVDATDSSIAHHGFAHFKNCKYIECIKFDNCLYLEDQGLKDLEAVKSSLESLIIWRCPNITDDGLLSLTSLLKLRTLQLAELKQVKDLKKCTRKLQGFLPNCNITMADQVKK